MTIMMIIMGNIQDENHDNQNLQAEDSTGRILIARVMHGGAADRSGLIAVGDEVGVDYDGDDDDDDGGGAGGDRRSV